MDPHRSPTFVRFGVYEVDLEAGELFKQGRRVRLQGKPFEVLRLLLDAPGQLVTRERLRERLWSDAVFVDFDTNLNTAVTRLREALGDSAENPRFIETLPRRGYRFIAEVMREMPLSRGLGPDALADARRTAVVVNAPTSAGSSATDDAVPSGDVEGDEAGASAAVALAPPGTTLRRRWVMRTALLVIAACAGGFGLYALAAREDSHLKPAALERVRLAVIPFEDLGDAAGAHIADGLTEELITQLGRLAPERLGVIGRASVMRFRSSPKPLRHIGDDLRVRFIVDGSIRRAGDRVRVAVRLSQPSDETVLWAEVYERDLKEGLALQIDIARAVARALAIDVLRNDAKALARATTASADAVDAYMRGLFELRRGKETSFVAAAAQFERAIAADPAFALAHAGWADAQVVQARYTLQSPESLSSRALDAARRAVALDDGLAQAHAILGSVYQLARQPEDAEREILRALELNPSLASVHEQYAWYLLERGRPADALAALGKARDLDPLSPGVAAARGYMLLVTGRPEKAEEEFNRALSIDGAFPFAHYGLGCLAQARGRYDDAIAAFTRAYASGSRAAKYGSALAEAYVRAGRRAEAARILEDLRALATKRYVPPFYLDRLASLIERPGT